MPKRVHIFQEKYTGVQIFIFHTESVFQARHKFQGVVIDSSNWEYLGIKHVTL